MLDAHLIETDAYDREARARALAGPSVRAFVEKGARVVPHFGALVEDLFAVFFKLVVRVREDAPRSTALNRHLLRSLLGSEAIAQLRATCSLDDARAASAALSVARAALQEIKKGEVLTDEELLGQAALRMEEDRLGELERTRDELAGEASEKMRARLDREIEKAKDRVEELADRVDEVIDEIPSTLEKRIVQAAQRAGESVESEEEQARTFAEGVGAGGPSTAAERLELAEKLRGNDKLKKLASLAGAFRRDALAARKKRIRRAASEVHKVGRGAELSRLLPSELSAYVDPRRRLDFLRRYAEADLAEYELVGSDRGGRGALVICVDASGSMSGPRELWAKATSLALLEVARRQNRRAEAIVFAGREAPLQRFELLNGKGRRHGARRLSELPKLLEFAACFPGGGTDFEKPLGAAVELLADSRLKGGDVVFVTDGEAPISEAFAERILDEKHRLDFEIYAVLIDDPSVAARRPAPGATRPEIERGARELRKITDRVTTVTRLTSGAVKDLFERL